MKMSKKGLLVVISGPSGVGKGTVLKEVFGNDRNLVYSVSLTTRVPRPNEIEGVSYYFLSRAEFEKRIAADEMLEYTEYCDHYYGTAGEHVEMLRNNGQDVVLEIETAGALQVKEKCPDAVMIFLCPPSFTELKSRLSGRATESVDTIEKRIKAAEYEMSQIEHYDYLVINTLVKNATDDILAILHAERLKIRI